MAARVTFASECLEPDRNRGNCVIKSKALVKTSRVPYNLDFHWLSGDGFVIDQNGITYGPDRAGCDEALAANLDPSSPSGE